MFKFDLNELNSVVHITTFHVRVFIFLSIMIFVYNVYHKYCGWYVWWCLWDWDLGWLGWNWVRRCGFLEV
jgi:hypothetical protein